MENESVPATFLQRLARADATIGIEIPFTKVHAECKDTLRDGSLYTAKARSVKSVYAQESIQVFI